MPYRFRSAACLAALAIALTTATAASAQRAGVHGAPTAGQPLGSAKAHHGLSFKAIDADHDGKIGPEEFKQAGEASLAIAKGGPKLFAAIDANHDGFISPAEFKAWRKKAKS